MSALQEILEKGYVDPELLEQLGEEQKQILFIKMREEQIRKWRLYEAEMENQQRMEKVDVIVRKKQQGKKDRKKQRSVQWLTGRDGNIWVWVMGEHPNDLSIEQILEKESKEKARHLAEKEILQTLRKVEDLPNSLESANTEALKLEFAHMGINTISRPQENATNNGEETVRCYGGTVPTSSSPYDYLMEHEQHQISVPVPTTDHSYVQSVFYPMTSSNDKVEENACVDWKEFYANPLTSFTTTSENIRQSNLQNGDIANHIPIRVKSKTIGLSNPPPVPMKPAFLRRTVSNAVTNFNDENNRSVSEIKTPNVLPALEQCAFNTIRSYIPESEFEKRQSKIFEQLREQRERLAIEAEEEASREHAHWEEQERRAREAEESIRMIAQKARQQHRKCLRTSEALLPLFQQNSYRMGGSTQSVREALKGLPRPPKPKSRHAIIGWFRTSELAHWQRMGPVPPSWFHGIISRLDAECLLEGKSNGAFLVRVTERIFGYTISYKAPDGMKNFLIERIPDGYQFMGTNQLVHTTLYELIAHHHSVPITTKGGEILREPVGQQHQDLSPDYEELFRV